jgi:serine/threonine protein kinase
MGRRGEVIGDRYVVLETLGVGGMATVFRARHLLSERTVALKVLHPQVLASPGASERFRREARAAGQIGHPGLVEVLDAGVDGRDGSLFLVMELLEGCHLGQHLDRGSVSRRAALDLVVDVLAPLAAAHAAGFVHRDLKPANVFVLRDDGGPRTKLVDLGLAKPVDAATLTASGVSLGTPQYMAPEQLRSADAVTPAADVWSAGVMLHQILTDRHPLEGPTPHAVLVRLLTETPPRLCDSAPSWLGLARVVDRCLEPSPEARFPDAGALREALQPLVELSLDALDEPVAAASLPSDPVAETVSAPAVPPATSPSDSWRLHEADAYRFRVPAGWEARTSFVPHVAAAYQGPEEVGGFRPRCQLKVEAFEGDTAAYVALGIERWAQVGRMHQYLDSALGGVPTAELDGDFPDASPPFRSLRRAVVVDGVGYVFGCDGPMEGWHRVVRELRAILDSFELVRPR